MSMAEKTRTDAEIEKWWDVLPWYIKEILVVCRLWRNMSEEEQNSVREMYARAPKNRGGELGR